MLKGIDVSENNGYVNWQDVKSNGYDFAIARLGFGHGHRDSNFYDNVNGILDNELHLGVYYYSYALTVEDAYDEAQYTIRILQDYGLTPDKLKMGVWFDMEDADGWKARHGMPDDDTITAICSKYICTLNEAGYSCGIYASYDWLVNRIHTDELADYVPYWPAQWSNHCDWTKNVHMWQYTNQLDIDGQEFDGNFAFECNEGRDE